MSTPMITNWKKPNIFQSKLVDPNFYYQLIGSLMQLVNTRLDLCFSINILSHYTIEPRRVHWVAKKHVLGYLWVIMDYGLDYRRRDGVNLTSYTNSDWEGNVVDRKSTSGCCFRLGLVVVSGSARNKSQWHWVLQRKSIWQLIRRVERPYGFTSYWLDYLINSCIILSFTATIRVASNSRKVWYFMIG